MCASGAGVRGPRIRLGCGASEDLPLKLPHGSHIKIVCPKGAPASSEARR